MSGQGPAASKRAFRVSGQAAWASSIAGAALVAAALVVTGADGFNPSTFQLSVSSSWLPSFNVGQVALVDGTTADTVAKVRVARGSGPLDVVQAASTALIVNRSRGRVIRVDGATLDTVSSVPFGGSTTLRAFPGPDAVYLYDWDGGKLATLDATTLAVVRRVSLDPAANADATLVDGAGRFWIIGRSGAVNRYDAAGNRTSSATVAAPAEASLLTVGNRAVVVDPSRSEVRELDPETGELGARTCVGGAGHRLRAAGSPTRDVVYFTDGRAGTLLLSDLRDRSCKGLIQVSPADSDLGAPVEAAGHVFIADRRHSTVVIVDPATGRVITRPVNVLKTKPFDLVSRSGIVWYNQPDTERAGVITVDGRRMETRKYDPKKPDHGLPGQDTVTTSSGRVPSRTRTPDPTPGRTVSPAATAGPSPSPSGGNKPTTTGGPANLRIGIAPPASPELGKTYGFKVMASGARLRSATWDFGDHQKAGGFSVTHVYTEAKSYQVTVFGRFEDGATAQASIEVAVHAKPVVQIVDLGPAEADEDVPVQLTATFRNGPPKSYQWRVLDPDNKVVFTSKDPHPTYTFSEPTPDAGKPYLVSLVVDDVYGGERGQNVTVGPSVPSDVTVECGRTSLVAGETIRCSATGNGSFLTWAWTLTGPDGVQQFATGESPDFATMVTAQGDYTVQAVATNRSGSSDPSPPVAFVVRQTAFEKLACDPSTVRAEESVACSLNFEGWSDQFQVAYWEFADAEGHRAAGAAVTAVDRGQFLLSPTFPAPGTYRLTIWYVAPWFVNPRPLDSGIVEVGAASRDVTVKVTNGQVKEGSNVCSRTCTWTYSDGDKVVLRATDTDGTTLSSQATVSWSGCQPAKDSTSCTLTVGRDNTVSATITQPARLELTVRGTFSSTCGGSSSSSSSSSSAAAALPVAWLAADDTPTPTTEEPEPSTTTKPPKPSPPTTTTTSKDDPDPGTPTPTKTSPTADPCSGLGKGEIAVTRLPGGKAPGVAEDGCAERKSGSCSYEHKAPVTWQLSDAKADGYKVTWSGCDSPANGTVGGKCLVTVDAAGGKQSVTATFH